MLVDGLNLSEFRFFGISVSFTPLSWLLNSGALSKKKDNSAVVI